MKDYLKQKEKLHFIFCLNILFHPSLLKKGRLDEVV